MNNDNWGPWIDWEGGECPIPDAKEWEFEVKRNNGSDHKFKHLDACDIYGWETGNIIAYRVRLTADDLLRQAIEALTNSCDLLESYIDTFGDMSGANRADLNDYRAVLTAYDKRGK